MIIVPVILAGGIGERFWPMSRSSSPKQLLKLISTKTMIEETIDRVASLCKKPVKPLIITGKAIAQRMRELLPSTCNYDCIMEPEGKNTAPAILLASAWIERKYGPAIMVILSADHDIRPRTSFISAVRTAVRFAASNDTLVIFGIRPNRPECGFGYLHIGETIVSTPHVKVCKVKQFIEKPSREKAQQFTKQKSYLWNSGMFVWKTSVILHEFRTLLPDLYAHTAAVIKQDFSQTAINRFYRDCYKISIDYGIMERSGSVCAVIGDFLWDDIGSWEAIGRIHGSNASGMTSIGSNVCEFDCKNTLIFNHGSTTVAAIGLDDMAVIATGDAVLVAHRSKLPDLKEYLARIKQNKDLPRELF